MKERFVVEMKKEKAFEDGKLDSIKVEARVKRYLEYDSEEELFIYSSTADIGRALGSVIIERYNLSEDKELCNKAWRGDIVPYFDSDNNLYKFLNDRRVFGRLMKEMVELMISADKKTANVEFGFYCGVESIKNSLIQAMDMETEMKLRELSNDKFRNITKEEVIVSKYVINKGADE